MNKNMPQEINIYKLNQTILVMLCLGTLLLGCKDEPKSDTSKELQVEETVDSTLTINEPKLNSDEQFMLEEDGIKILLPTGFSRYSAVEYQNYLESKYKSNVLRYYMSRLRQLRNMDGSLYIYFDESTKSTVTINTTPPKEISKDNAQELLSMVRSDQREIEEATKRTYEKVTVGFSDKSEVKIFKAIYKVSGADLKQPHYAHSYIITTDNKTLYLNADTSTEVDFDPYIEKMQF